MEIKEKVLEIVAANCEDIELEEITEESSFMEDLDLASLEIFSLVSEIEDEFNIRITERELQNIPTVGDMIRLIEGK